MFNHHLNRHNVGIDLGTTTVLTLSRKKDLIINEPSVVAIERRSGKIAGFGNSAKTIFSRNPEHYQEIYPLKEGVIFDFEITENLLGHYYRLACSRFSLRKPTVFLSFPMTFSIVEKRILLKAIKKAGAKAVYLIEQTRAAAIGAGLNISRPSGVMVVDIGGSITDIAVISLGQIIAGGSLRLGGFSFDQAIVNYLREERGLLINERQAETLKTGIGALYPAEQALKMAIKAHNIKVGSDNESVVLSSADIAPTLEEPLMAIAAEIKNVLGKIPPELFGDIMDEGIMLTGGGSLLRGLDKFLSRQLDIQCTLAEHPIFCTIKGVAQIIKNPGTMFSNREDLMSSQFAGRES